jgi:hypothetical protein
MPALDPCRATRPSVSLTMAAPPVTRPVWAAHQSKIKDLYWNQKKELPEVMEIMKEHHGFVATYASLLSPVIRVAN